MSGERLTVPGLVRRWADEQPDRDFVVTDDDTLTYGELDAQRQRSPAHFADLGVGKGTPVGVLMTERHHVAGGGVRRESDRRDRSCRSARSSVRPSSPRSCGPRASSASCCRPSSSGATIVADLMDDLAELVSGTQLVVDALPRLRTITVWEEHDAAVTRRRRGASSSLRSTARSGRPTISRSCSRPAAAAPRRV